ncbi:hypothetical protein VIGAN_09210200 [Vigna angularis var. angularis]|uniref:OCEL domain-containing protein n=1 Tax=Vigna angularis var. angularis TaxID=157739 RepID=A0A0S3SZX3_PHAAN|nr:hypothetical protein VIGAN_09210200 [Vigna angularis var. angularis]
MYGGASSKLGRGGSNRRSFPPPPAPQRSSAPGGRLSLGSSSRNAAKETASTAAVEETFSLTSGSNPLAFSMIIRLAPDLVEEIRRVESQGGTARMKFGPNPHSGNIIDVGGKEYRFTWSRELGDLCDIYEERRSGEDGNGLLVESGCAWRKLNVQRILDESTKNHVKRRSEEAERKMKSRKAIVLEPGNPPMKSQIKELAAVEATTWKNYSKKKEAAALKKRKVETLQVGGPPKSSHRSGLTSTNTNTKGKHSSPLPSPPDPFAASSSPLVVANMSKSFEDAMPVQMTGKQDTNVVSEKEISTRTNNAVRNTPGGKGPNGSKPADLQGMLISLLKDKPSGMTLKALEKAVGDTLPNSIKKIEQIIKKIAKFQAPGRYILKPEVGSENLNKPQIESGSSPDGSHSQMPTREEFHDQTSVPQGGSEEKVPNVDMEETVNVKSKVEQDTNSLEKVDAQHTSPDILGDKKGSDHSEGQAGSSSDSGSDSDSDSDSSDSGSDSGSHSRSRSPAGSGSGSSSDSESDASSSSKEGLEGSDEDVDIMTSDDEKESKQKAEVSDQRMPLPIQGKSPHGRSMQNEVDEKQDGNESDPIEIEKDLPEEPEAELDLPPATIPNRGGKYAEETRPFSIDYEQFQERQNYIGSLFDEKENEVKDSSRHEQSDSSDRFSKGKHKRVSDMKNVDEKSAKRLKAELSPSIDAQTLKNSRNLSPYEFTEDIGKGPSVPVLNRADRQANLSVGLQKGPNRSFPGKSSSDFPQKSSAQTPLENPSYSWEKSDKQGESVRHSKKHSANDFPAREASSVQKDKSHKDASNEDINATEKKVSRNSRDGSNGSKEPLFMDSHYQEQGEMVGKSRERRQSTQSHLGTSPKESDRRILDQSPVTNGQGVSLQRELSDLELGELRESTPDETHVTKQFERKGSFKQLEKKANTSEDRNLDITRVKPSLKANSDSGKQSSAFVNSGFPSNLDSTYKKNSDNHFEDSTKSRSRVMQTHSQHLKADNAEVGSQNKLVETSSKYRNNESGVSRDTDLEGRSESNRGVPANASKQQDGKGAIVFYPGKESKRQTSNSVEEMADGGKDSGFADRNHSDQKKRESSSDENSCSYSKYEKDEPELKGPIRSFSQYKEYVEEFRDKYDSYNSLHKILDGYRDEFQKLGEDLEHAKARDTDRYYDLLGQLKDSFRHCEPVCSIFLHSMDAVFCIVMAECKCWTNHVLIHHYLHLTEKN